MRRLLWFWWRGGEEKREGLGRRWKVYFFYAKKREGLGP
jgi:hypothetical protein